MKRPDFHQILDVVKENQTFGYDYLFFLVHIITIKRFQLNKFAENLNFISMDRVESKMEQNHIPSKNEMEKMNNDELFEVANRNPSFRKVMVKFISSFEVKPVVFIYDEEGKYNVRSIGLPERIKKVITKQISNYFELFHL